MPEQELPALPDWPFADPSHAAVITTRYVLDGSPIVFVSRDADDGSWQFHAAEVADLADVLVVSLQRIVTLDPSIHQLADLPPGWEAERGVFS